jgi:DNA-binding NtrC family response regulator
MSAVGLIGRSDAHLQLLEKLRKVASTDAEVLFTGQSGTGKERYARFLHQESRRGGAAFVPVNCGALPVDLLENELFGHVGGAFTGARARSDGLVAQAEHGTLFLDEVDSLPPLNQVKVLRFVQEKEYRRLGDSRTRKADVRFLAATNADLPELVRAGRFRADLFFRLRVVPVEVPSLRARPQDVPLLLEQYAEHYAEEYGAPRVEFSPAARRVLDAYAWPGNIRELENCVRYLTCLQLARPAEPSDLPLLDSAGPSSGLEEAALPADHGDRSFQEAKRTVVDQFERGYVEQALRKTDGNIARAARESGKDRRAFFELMRKHGLKAQP